MRSSQSILSALLNHLRPETQSMQAEIKFASLKHLQTCIEPVQASTRLYQERPKICPLHRQFVLYVINSVSSEAFTIKRFSEIKTFHRYHHALKKEMPHDNLCLIYYCLC